MTSMKRLFIGRLDRGTRTRDLEDVFESYGKLSRCEIKSGGTDSAYAFIDYENDRDAEDALKGEHGRRLNGSAMVVEWAKGKSRRPMDMDRGGRGGYDRGGYDRGGYSSRDECFRCGRRGHWGRDCPMQGYRNRGRGRSPEYRSSRRSRYSRSRSRSDSRGRSRSRSRSAKRSVSRSPRKTSRSPRKLSRSPRRSASLKKSASRSPRRSKSANRKSSHSRSRSPS